jgi:hypothetical protein
VGTIYLQSTSITSLPPEWSNMAGLAVFYAHSCTSLASPLPPQWTGMTSLTDL